MVGKKANALRQYHLLVFRDQAGFGWQVRYNRHATPVEVSLTAYKTAAEAQEVGREALARHQAAMMTRAD